MEKVDAPVAEKEEVIGVDLHVDVPWIMTKYRQFNLADGSPNSMLSLKRMKDGGLHILFCALYLSETLQDDLGPSGVNAAIDRQISWLVGNLGTSLVDSALSAEHVLTWNATPIFLGLEGGRLLNGSLARLRRLRSIGVRYLTLTHNKRTQWADSATDTPYHKGLARFGIDVVKECNELGVFVDISHASDATAEVALSISTKPVLATHSGCRDLNPHPRNLPDHLIKEIAKKGGLIGVPFARKFTGNKWTSVAEHIDHIVQLVGPSYVGIGSDMDGAEMAEGIVDASDWKKVVIDEMYRRGYPDPDIIDIAGRNVLRLMR